MAIIEPKINKFQTPDDQRMYDHIIEHFQYNPLGYVLYMYPWGVPGTRLENYKHPEEWQIEFLVELGERRLRSDAVTGEAIQMATRAGHGVGKSALMSWVGSWLLDVAEEAPQIIYTANTKTQLLTKTWRELAVWNRMAKNGHWHSHTATKFARKGFEDVWYASAIPWNEAKPDAFQGAHEKRVALLFDEASAIPYSITEAAAGAMTTPGAMWFKFGNPTVDHGDFNDCFGGKRHRWSTREIDSRTVSITNKAKIQEWLEDYGEDSDYFRVRVRGLPPKAGNLQFIPSALVDAAMDRGYRPMDYAFLPKVMGVDCARFGDDETVISIRQGLQHTHMWPYRELSADQAALIIKAKADENDVDGMVIDMGNIGAAIYDILVNVLHVDNVVGVDFGSKALDQRKYANRRAEIWGAYLNWLNVGGALIKDNKLRDDSTGVQYGYNIREQIQLEKKDDMKKRGLASPDRAESVIVTFAATFERKDPEEQLRIKRALESGGSLYDEIEVASGDALGRRR